MVYKYQNHSDIPGYMKSYLLTVSHAPFIEAIPVGQINDFLNGVEEWDTEQYPDTIARSNMVH